MRYDFSGDLTRSEVPNHIRGLSASTHQFHHEKTHRMSTQSIKYRVVTATLLVAGLQCGFVVPSIAAEPPVTTHPSAPKSVGHNAEQNDPAPNAQKQNAASKVTMKAQLQEGGFLLRWNGFPQELTATDILVAIDFYTVTGEYGGSIVENPQVSEEENGGEYSLLMSLAKEKEIVYVIVLTDSINNISYEFFVKEDGKRLVQTVDPRNGKAKPTETPVDIEREEAGTPEPSPSVSPTLSSGAESDQDEDNQHLSPAVRDTLHPTPEGSTATPVKAPRGRYAVSEDNSVYDPQNQRKGKARLSVQESQGDSQDETKPVTILGTNFPQNASGYDLMVMEVDSEGNTVGDALAIVHVDAASISAGSFEAVIGVPGASLQIGKTYLVVVFDASGDGNLQINTVRFTVAQAPSEGEESTGMSEEPSDQAPSVSPTAISSSDSAANSAAGGNKVRSIRSDTAMAPGPQDATISIPRPSRSSSPESSSALGYRTEEAQAVQTTPESVLPSGNDSAVQSRRAAILNGSSSKVHTESGAPNGVKATEAQITGGVEKSSPLLPILVTLGGGLILGALGMSRFNFSKRD